ncbi:MAG: ATP-dependent Clp protease proteolytic subunit [Candidatus Tectomicrobia bacterium]|nr:ATP-dependent Clp protease proteolytic subunit [Candidatus Tectomicrobia bacterium]
MAEPNTEWLDTLQATELDTHLLRARRIMLPSQIDEAAASAAVSRLLLLEAEQPEEPITLYINSSGDDPHAGLAVYDAMQAVRSPVSTVCIGTAAGMGALLLAAGAEGHRFASPHARITMHLPMAETLLKENATEVEIQMREWRRTRANIHRLYTHHTGQDIDRIARDTERADWMSAADAQTYGLIDTIQTST